MIMGNTAEEFIRLRESTGMNRKDFADYLGVPYRTMSDWEHGLRTMPQYVMNLMEFKVRTEFGTRLPQELDPNTIGNVRRGLEDQLEQNDNMIGDGVINNIGMDEKENDTITEKEDESIPDETVSEKEQRTSILQQLRDAKQEPESERKHKIISPVLEIGS